MLVLSIYVLGVECFKDTVYITLHFMLFYIFRIFTVIYKDKWAQPTADR